MAVNEGLLNFFDWTAMIAVVVAVGALLVAGYHGFTRYTPWPGPGKAPEQTGSATLPKSVIVFAACILTAFLCWFALTTKVRSFVSATLEPAASPRLLLDGRPLAKSESLIAALRSLRSDRHRRSASEVRFSVEIRSASGNVTLDLVRDSMQANAYWVFVPSFLITANNDIGFIYTDVFSDSD